MIPILTSILAAALLQPGNSLAGGVASVSNSVPSIRVKEVQIAGKKINLKAELTAARGLLQIRQWDRSADANMNGVVADVAVNELGRCGFDFAMTPTGDILWVFVQQISAGSRQPVCLIYPLVQEHNGTTKYAHLTMKKQIRSKQYDVLASLDLTALLRNLVIGSFQKGHPLSLGREAHISDVQLDSTKAASVVVTGNIGANYSFCGTVMLGVNNTIVTKDFAIEPTKQKMPSDSR